MSDTQGRSGKAEKQKPKHAPLRKPRVPEPDPRDLTGCYWQRPSQILRTAGGARREFAELA